MTDYTFSSSATLPGGRSIYVSIDVPTSAATPVAELADYSEFVQIAVANVMRNVFKSDELWAERHAEEVDEMNAAIVAKLNEKAPF